MPDFKSEYFQQAFQANMALVGAVTAAAGYFIGGGSRVLQLALLGAGGAYLTNLTMLATGNAYYYNTGI